MSWRWEHSSVWNVFKNNCHYLPEIPSYVHHSSQLTQSDARKTKRKKGVKKNCQEFVGVTVKDGEKLPCGKKMVDF